MDSLLTTEQVFQQPQLDTASSTRHLSA